MALGAQDLWAACRRSLACGSLLALRHTVADVPWPRGCHKKSNVLNPCFVGRLLTPYTSNPII